ncbi:MAG: LCP family protein [Lachnospiraceae bacterium]|nr:LCP family protein [Lachnospiraceae bacterium]
MGEFNEDDLRQFDLGEIKRQIANQVNEQINKPAASVSDYDDFDNIDDLLDDTTMSFTQDFEYYAGESVGASEDSYEEEDVDPDDDDIPVRKRSFTERSKKKKNWFKRMPVWGKILFILGVILLAAILAGVIYYNYLLGLVNVQKEDEIETQVTYNEAEIESIYQEEDDEENAENLETMNEEDFVWDLSSDYRHEDGVYNILLLGLDKQESTYGRSDAIIIATLNENTKTLSLCSIMRDCYVKIADYNGKSYRPTKINAAHAIAGAPITVLTVEENFNIAIDGYVEVDFEAFEKVVDALGGVELTFTDAEVRYLNGSNSSIVDPANRHVKAGTLLRNGAEALGYARIRKVTTSDGLTSDFGRTSRQRIVLNALFEKYKSASALDLLSLMQAALPYVTTDLDKDAMTSLLYKVVAATPKELKMLNIPVDGKWSNKYVEGSGSVIALDVKQNKDAIHEFIFGSVE